MWELVHPPCAVERKDDLEEVEAMIAAGELEVALEELRWLVEGCGDFIDAHKLLGDLALARGDLPLARGHYGHAFRLGDKASEALPAGDTLPYSRPANRAFLDSAKGLIVCLVQLGKPDMAREVKQRLIDCDPSDPFGVGGG